MRSVEIKQRESCYHCGDSCKGEPLLFEEKAFCCEGCKAVYQLLSENQLCGYYQMEKNPGKTVVSDNRNDRFAFLDAADVKKRFIQFSDGHRTNAEFTVPQMHCTSCIWLLENLFKLNSAILLSRVDFPRRKVAISFDESRVKLSEVVSLMSKVGYEPELRMEHLREGKQKADPENLGMKIGLAGFAFGNIMLFSLPEYFSAERIPGLLINIFGGLNIIISLPVLLYSASGFFKSAYTGLKQKHINMDLPISLGILALYGRSLYEVLSGFGPGYFDSFAGLIFFLNLGKLAQRKTFNALSFDRDYASFFPISVARLHAEDHSETVVPITQIEVGDSIRLRNQELIPADAVLLSDRCEVDYSFVTGESDLVTRLKGETLYAGGRMVGKQAEMVVSKAISQSYLTGLWNNPVFTKAVRSNDFSQWTTNIAGYFTAAVMVIAGVSTFYWLPIDTGIATHVFISVLIIACPCALAMSSPFTLGTSLNVLSSNGFFLKNGNVLERLASLKNIVFDKTGTLTELQRDGIESAGRELTSLEKTAAKTVFSQSTHPLSRNLFAWFGDVPVAALDAFAETEGRGVEGTVNGLRIVAGSRGFLAEHRIQVSERIQQQVYLAINGVFASGFSMVSNLRGGMGETVKKLKKAGLKLHVVSGDVPRDYDLMRSLFGAEAGLSFEKKPQEKLEQLTLIQLSGPVAMVGDGLNDAGALKGSDVGIAVTDDIKSFTPASDAILSSNSLHKLPDFIGFAKSARAIVWTSFGISFLYNFVGLSFAVTGNLSPLVSAILMPVSSLSVIGFTSGAMLLIAMKKGLRPWKF